MHFRTFWLNVTQFVKADKFVVGVIFEIKLVNRDAMMVACHGAEYPKINLFPDSRKKKFVALDSRISDLLNNYLPSTPLPIS